MVGSFECEVTKCLWRVAYVSVFYEARIGIVLDVFALDEVLQMVQWRVGSILELEYGHLEHVDFFGRVVTIKDPFLFLFCN